MIIQKTGKGDIDFDGIKWAIGVRSKDIRQKAICCVNMSGGVLCGTDRFRLHLYTPEREIENGNYEVTTDTAKLIVLEPKDVDYPNYNLIIPSDTHGGIDPISTPNNKQDRDNLVINKVLKSSDLCFDIKYLIEACPCNENLFFEESAGPFLIKNADGSKRAVLMPLNI